MFLLQYRALLVGMGGQVLKVLFRAFFLISPGLNHVLLFISFFSLLLSYLGIIHQKVRDWASRKSAILKLVSGNNPHPSFMFLVSP